MWFSKKEKEFERYPGRPAQASTIDFIKEVQSRLETKIYYLENKILDLYRKPINELAALEAFNMLNKRYNDEVPMVRAKVVILEDEIEALKLRIDILNKRRSSGRTKVKN